MCKFTWLDFQKDSGSLEKRGIFTNLTQQSFFNPASYFLLKILIIYCESYSNIHPKEYLKQGLMI